MMDKNADQGPAKPRRSSRLILAVLASLVAAAGFGWLLLDSTQHPQISPTPSAWAADEAQCQQCHLAQFRDWQGSHHQLAMLQASESTVRGDFNNTSLHDGGDITAFFRQGEEFWVRTADATGRSGDFRVAYTFGWEPLQQYLLALDDGRLQALGVAWDTEQERWFHLYAGEGIDARHSLHWSGAAQNGNTQCIECHTTGFQLGYDALNERFDSQWQSLGVGCQACHGPAGEHLQWARSSNTGDLNRGFAKRLDRGPQQLDTCAGCHSRRTPLGQFTQEAHLEDAFLLSPLSADLYEVDGKILGEVFEHGSFLQSPMHKAGVVCSDCHNPHSGKLRAEGNGVCTQCHNPAAQPVRDSIRAEGLRAADYNSPAHHHHQPGTPGAACSDCHMPGKIYMGNDLRHDHSFSSPNPAQAIALKHSDACLDCHTGQAAESLITQFRQWYPDHQGRDGGYAPALFKARQGLPGAADALLAQLARDDLPPIRRAALVAELAQYPSPESQQQLLKALGHDESAVRRAAIENAGQLLEPGQFQSRLATLLNDPVGSVRTAASEQLLLMADQFGAAVPADLFHEYEQTQGQLLANAEAHFNLANLYRLSGRADQVEGSLQAALKRNPGFSPASIALAQWLDGASPGVGLRLLEEQARIYPEDADLHHALGLARIRARQLAEGVSALEQAHHLAPDNGNYAYVLAVAWHDTGRRERALDLLREQVASKPANRALRLALLAYLPEGKERSTLIEELRQQNPRDPMLTRH